MSNFSTDRYTPQPVGVNGTAVVTNQAIGGFLCYTAGTLTLTRLDGTVLINAFPVAAGTYTPLPFRIGSHGGTVTLAGGASGVVAV